MILRIAFVAAALVVATLVLRRPAPQAAIQTLPGPSAGSLSGEPAPHRERRHALSADDELVVYVVGAVKRPGLYRLRGGDRDSRAVALAGGLTAAADAAGVNLAQRAADGEEIDVPASGAVAAPHSRAHRGGSRRHARATPAPASVDVNAADEGQLASVPGIGRAIAARIVMLRSREGNFASLDELLDVAGMTQGRLERARPYLREL